MNNSMFYFALPSLKTCAVDRTVLRTSELLQASQLGGGPILNLLQKHLFDVVIMRKLGCNIVTLQ